MSKADRFMFAIGLLLVAIGALWYLAIEFDFIPPSPWFMLGFLGGIVGAAICYDVKGW